ncbi:MAG: hypothetical protein AB1432_11735 [Bacteroidota bacterium]
MEKLNNISKFFLFLTFVFGVFWLGGYFIRQIVVYQFFLPEDLSLRSIYKNQNLEVVINTIAPIFVTNLLFYIAFIVTYFLFLISSRIKFKNEGWILFITLIVLITAPFEIYLLVKDYRLISDIYFNNVSAFLLLDQIKARIEVLSSFSLIEIFSYVGIIFLIVFRPLRKANEN